MDCRTTLPHKFRRRLEFKQYDQTNRVHLKGKICKLNNNIFSCKIDLYFHGYKLAVETDKNWHSDRNINYEKKRQKAIKQELGCKFIRIDPDQEDLDIFRTINEIFRHIKQSTKKARINRISKRLIKIRF